MLGEALGAGVLEVCRWVGHPVGGVVWVRGGWRALGETLFGDGGGSAWYYGKDGLGGTEGYVQSQRVLIPSPPIPQADVLHLLGGLHITDAVR